MPRHLLILGNSAAALSAVRAIRARGGDERISIVSKEACHAYSPVLTTYYLRGVTPERQLYLCDESSYRDLELDCHFGLSAVELHSQAQSVVFDDGTEMGYDALLIATGAAPKRLGGELDPEVAAEICYLRTIEDARRIRRLAERARHVVIFGAGLVSMQVAGALARPDLRLTCVVASRQILSQNIDAECASLLCEHIERSSGITFLFGRNVSEISRTESDYRLILDSGEELTADLLVAGKGVVPNIDFVDRQQIVVEAGVIVDDYMRTNVRNVYAAGDAAQGRNRLNGRSELIANWIDACEQGRIAGLNMAAAEVAFPGSLAENITTLFGAPVASIGITRTASGEAGSAEHHYRDDGRGAYRRLFYQDERLVGAILLRSINDAGLLRNAIATGGKPEFSAEDLVTGRVSFAGRIRSCWGVPARGAS